MSEPTLTMWTVYDHPSDYPDKFVARPYYIGSGMAEPEAGKLAIVADTLDEVRAALPLGLHRIPREAGDDPVIVETWV